MTGVDGVGFVGFGGGVERMVPFCLELVAGFDLDDVFGERLVQWVRAVMC